MNYEGGSSMMHVDGSYITFSVKRAVGVDGVKHHSDRIRLQSHPSNSSKEGLEEFSRSVKHFK